MADTSRRTIRSFRSDDAERLVALVQTSIRGLGARAYSREQIAAWSSRHHEAARFEHRHALGHRILLAVDDEDEPAAFTLYEPDGHLDMLYCHPAHAGRGLATALIHRVEAEASAAGVPRLTTEASDLARPVFENAGWTTEHRRDFALGDVPIHNWAMVRHLG